MIPIKATGALRRRQSLKILRKVRPMFRISSYIREIAVPTPLGPRRQPPELLDEQPEVLAQGAGPAMKLPDLPPSLARSRIPSIRIAFSAAFSMS